MSQQSLYLPADAQTPPPVVSRSRGRRVLEMALAWAAIGVVAGAAVMAREPGFARLVAGSIAGVILFTPLGALLGLIGGRWKETVTCSAAGLALAALAAASGQLDQVENLESVSLPAFGMVYGGLVGSTFVTCFYRLPRRILRLIRRSADRAR